MKPFLNKPLLHDKIRNDQRAIANCAVSGKVRDVIWFWGIQGLWNPVQARTQAIQSMIKEQLREDSGHLGDR